MSTPRLMLCSIVLACVSAPASAQPARPVDPSTRTVTLSLTEYNRLLDLSARPTADTDTAPVGATLASADLRVRVDGQTARGQFTLTGDVFREGVHRVPLLAGGTILSAATSGGPLPLVAEGSTHLALLQGVGPFTATLEWGATVASQPGRAAFVLPVPPSGTAHATIDIPGDQADVRVSNGLITRRSTAGGRTLIEVTLRPNTPADVSWTMRDSAPVTAARDVRTVANVLTLVTLADSDVRMAALVDVTVVQGEPRIFEARIPSGYAVTSVSGGSLETSDEREDRVVMTVGDAALRHHQFLIGLERAHDAGSFSLESGVVSLPDVQRERGEIAIEGVGTLELTSPERGGVHRLDVRELNAALVSMASTPLLAAFRYQRTDGPPAQLSLEVKRFDDAGVLAAMADTATVTTMVTSEGRALTEVILLVRNRAQPFMKVTLPQGATLASVEVAGETAKPVVGADGVRVPLLRPGFRPVEPYRVSFVYMHAGTPFAKKGDMAMALPRMHLPIALLLWEMFIPEQYSTKVIAGNVINQRLVGRVGGFPPPALTEGWERFPTNHVLRGIPFAGGAPGRVRGRVTDSSGAVLAGVKVELEVAGTRRAVVTAEDGSYVVTDLPSGVARITASLHGFQTDAAEFAFDQRSREFNPVLRVGALEETITVSSASPIVDQSSRQQAPSQNVINLQRRVSGVLPIRIDVPRAGTSHQFVKPLVIDQEATVTLRYKRR